ncbi:MAG: hypothetical protein QW734_04495 [Candidatus Bathyarchaeia archaeon]
MCAKYYLAAIGKNTSEDIKSDQLNGKMVKRRHPFKVYDYLEFEEKEYERLIGCPSGGQSKMLPTHMAIHYLNVPKWIPATSILDRLPKNVRKQFLKRIKGAEFLVELYDIHPNSLNDDVLGMLYSRYIGEYVCVFVDYFEIEEDL